MNELHDLKTRLVGYFIGGRTPRADQMPEVEALRDRIAVLEKELSYS